MKPHIFGFWTTSLRDANSYPFQLHDGRARVV